MNKNADDKYFLLYSSCIPVKGANRSIICDLQKSRYKLIPNLLFDVLVQLHNKPISEVKKSYDNDIDSGIDSYTSLLLEEDWGHFTKNPEKFPRFNMEWDNPSQITNAIIDFNSESSFNIADVISQLNDLGCEAVQIRCFDDVGIDFINVINESSKNSCITFIEILMPFSEDLVKYNQMIGIVQTNMRFKSIVFHSSTTEKIDTIEMGRTHLAFIHYIKNVIDSNIHCGIVNPSIFTVNIPSFTEANFFNSCLNRKISVDEKGNIKNCPSMSTIYGNIKTEKLSNALLKSAFKDIWNIKKDQISVCKDCEFRYICTDCRAYIQDKNDLYSKPQKCNYDPYKSTWTA